MTWLTKLSLTHRRIVAVLSLALIAVGVFLAPTLRQQLIPDLAFPVVSVTAQYPGAGPAVVESEVTEPIENAVSGVTGVESVASTSSQGEARIQLSFDFSQDLDQARADTSAAIAAIQGLPQAATASVVNGSTADQPVIVLSATTTGDFDGLGAVLEDQVVPELQNVDDVNDVTLTGVQSQQISVVPDEERLAGYGLSVSSIRDALSALGGTSSAGVLDADGKTLSIGVGEAVSSVDDVKNVSLAGHDANGPVAVHLSDVAEVSLQDVPQTTITRTDGKPSLGIGITMVHDGSASTVSDGVRDVLDQLQSTLPDGTELTVLADSGPPVHDAIEGLLIEGLIGLVMAIAVILLFLRSATSTIVTAISIPTSLIIAIIALWARDDSLNLLTLGGLTIAVGRVVDDSIVVLENIKRHLTYGEERRAAIIGAVREVASAVVSSTMTTVAVFVPIVLLGGFIGELFAPFAVAVGAAMLGSLLISLTIVPTLAYWFLRAKPIPEGVTIEEHRAQAEEKESKGLLQRTYRPVLTWALGRRAVVVSMAGVILIGTVFLALGLKTNFLGDTGQGTVAVTQTMPAGTDLVSTDAAAEKVEQAIDDVDGIASHQTTVTGGNARYTMVLDDDADIEEVQDSLTASFAELTGVGDVAVNVTGAVSSDTITVQLQGDDAALADSDKKVVAALSDLTEVSDVTSGLSTGFPAISITTRGDAAAENGVTDAMLTGIVAQAVQGSTVGEVNRPDFRSVLQARMEHDEQEVFAGDA